MKAADREAEFLYQLCNKWVIIMSVQLTDSGEQIQEDEGEEKLISVDLLDFQEVGNGSWDMRKMQIL